MRASLTRNALDAADDVAAMLDAMSERLGHYYDAPGSWHARHHEEEQKIADKLARDYGARIRPNWDGARVSMLGVSATSTSGIARALRNWVAAVRKRTVGQ